MSLQFLFAFDLANLSILAFSLVSSGYHNSLGWQPALCFAFSIFLDLIWFLALVSVIVEG